MSRLIKKAFIMLSVLFLIYSLSRNIFNYQKKINFYENYKQDYEKSREENKKLKSDILKSTDYYTAEKDIRNKLNRTKNDEIMVIIPHVSEAPTPTPTPIKSPPEQWIKVFF